MGLWTRLVTAALTLGLIGAMGLAAPAANADIAARQVTVSIYRVTRQPIRGAGQVHSRTVQLAVYRWQNVNDLPITEYDDAEPEPDPDEPGYFVVDVDGTCAVFETTVGALDGNTEGTQVQAKVTGDDEVLSDETYAVGDNDLLTLDIRGFTDVRVDTVTVEQDVNRGLGVGSPRMLCTS